MFWMSEVFSEVVFADVWWRGCINIVKTLKNSSDLKNAPACIACGNSLY